MDLDAAPVLFLVDVDNTLLDNDGFQDDLKAYIAKAAGPEAQARYWAIQETLFQTLGYRDYLGAFQTYRLERPMDADAIWLSLFVVDYPFSKQLYPGALDVVAALRRLGTTVALTDGDAVFQPIKLASSGLRDALDNQVMICVHKDKDVPEIERRYPARHYVVIDDKIRLLSEFKRHWGHRVTTVFPRQGQFGRDMAVIAANPPADITIDHIADLLDPAILAQLHEAMASS